MVSGPSGKVLGQGCFSQSSRVHGAAFSLGSPTQQARLLIIVDVLKHHIMP